MQFTPPALDNIGYKTYIIFAILNGLWVPIIHFYFPETKGLELEDVDRIFAGAVTGQESLGEDEGDVGGKERGIVGVEERERVRELRD